MKDFILSGHILISSNTVNDTSTNDNIILVFKSDKNLTTGIILNKPIQDLYLDRLLDQLNVAKNDKFNKFEDVKLYFGGPEDISKGFVIHTNDKTYNHTINIGNDLNVTYSLDILRDISNGITPKRYAVMIGVVNWKGDELAIEMEQNTWLSVKATPELVFFDNYDMHKDFILNKMGVKQSLLSCFYGNA